MRAAAALEYSAHKAQAAEGLSAVVSFIIDEALAEAARLHAIRETALARSALEELVAAVGVRNGVMLTSHERDTVCSYLERTERPFGILQELVEDPSVSDIIVSQFDRISVQRARSNVATSKSFASPTAYRGFLERLLGQAGTSISTKRPIADGMIGSSARIHAVHDSLCATGPYLTIRLNRFDTVELSQLEQAGMAPSLVLDYLARSVSAGRTVLVVGEVGTGKTTLVRALAGAIPPAESLLVIEDTPEIRVTHPHVRYLATRENNTDGEGRVAPAAVIRAGMRMAMNRIIFGEIRDAESAEALIDVCSSGHPGMSTIHARSAPDAITRLELFLGRAQPSVERAIIREQIATAIDIVVHVNICAESGCRRVTEVREIGAVADGALRYREIFRYFSDRGRPAWRIINRVSNWRDVLESGDRPCGMVSAPAVLELTRDGHDAPIL